MDPAEIFVRDLLETSKKNSPIDFVQIGAEIIKELEELGGVAKLIKDRIKHSANEHVKARMLGQVMDILAKAASEQPASKRVSDLEPDQLKTLFNHITQPILNQTWEGGGKNPLKLSEDHLAPQPMVEPHVGMSDGTDAKSPGNSALDLDSFGQ